MSEHDHQHAEGHRRFRIWVAGRLGEGFAEGIGAIEQRDAGGVTTLTGDLIDQSQVHGLLDRLRDLGVEVLRFEIDGPGVRQESQDKQGDEEER